MGAGQVGYHRPENVRRVEVEKNNPIVKELNRTKIENFPDLKTEQQDRLEEIRLHEKEKRKREDKAKRVAAAKAAEERRRIKEERSYDRIMCEDNMTSNTGFNATEDNSAAVEYEDDFF